MPDILSNVETRYPNKDWDNIWKILSFKYMHVNDRPIIFKYIHEIIPTNKRLHQIRCRGDAICNNCDQVDTIRHKFYDCRVMQECLNWLRRLTMYMCNMNTDHNSFAQFMSFDIPRFEAKIKNTLTIILRSYIACTWYNRDRLEVIGYILKAKRSLETKN